jgi:hypothetical protein
LLPRQGEVFSRKTARTKNERQKVGGVIDSRAAFTHGGYVLNCLPTHTTEGGYTPSVVILRSSDGEFVANRLFPAELCFTDARAAIEHARDWAMGWIDASRPEPG